LNSPVAGGFLQRLDLDKISDAALFKPRKK
jgi:hypothetical protein